MHYTLNPYGHLRGEVSGGKFHTVLFTVGGRKVEKTRGEKDGTSEKEGRNTSGQNSEFRQR